MLLDLSSYKLTKRQEIYFRMMYGKYGVLYLTSKPGIAKSAIGKRIAEKTNHDYMDIRLTLIDETDVGLYPKVSTVDGVDVLDHVVPKWAIEANKRPTIIHFEELNRASQAVRNAALQILLERAIGTDFKFNDNVLMMASGNLGDEDNTDVEEFDSALNNRLIHVKHSLSLSEWLEDFAFENVHSSITSFLKSHPDYFYKTSGEDSSYATPRSWTMLSEFIIKNFGMESKPEDFVDMVREIAHSYVGPSANKYIKFLENSMYLKIDDIINRWDEVSEIVSGFNRDRKSELIQTLKDIDITKLKDEQLLNISNFLKIIGDDERVGYLLHLVDDGIDISKEKIKRFMLHFEDDLSKILRLGKSSVNT